MINPYIIDDMKSALDLAIAIGNGTNKDGTEEQHGSFALAYQFGRYKGTVEYNLRHGVEHLVAERDNLDKLQQVVRLLGLDDPAVIDRILALNHCKQGMLQETITEALDYHDVLNAPEPEIEYTEDEDNE